MEEVRRHNTGAARPRLQRHALPAVYLQFHPGSVEELMRAAGDDATKLFDEVHPWVNAEAMLEPCCVGRHPGRARAGSRATAAPPAAGGAPLHADEWRPFVVLSREPAAADAVLLRFTACR
jgi:hypothetical protein